MLFFFLSFFFVFFFLKFRPFRTISGHLYWRRKKETWFQNCAVPYRLEWFAGYKSHFEKWCNTSQRNVSAINIDQNERERQRDREREREREREKLRKSSGKQIHSHMKRNLNNVVTVFGTYKWCRRNCPFSFLLFPAQERQKEKEVNCFGVCVCVCVFFVLNNYLLVFLFFQSKWANGVL